MNVCTFCSKISIRILHFVKGDVKFITVQPPCFGAERDLGGVGRGGRKMKIIPLNAHQLSSSIHMKMECRLLMLSEDTLKKL